MGLAPPAHSRSPARRPTPPPPRAAPGADDYNTWAKQGCTGWSYTDCLPYFIKSEGTRIATAEAGFHGQGGLLATTLVTKPNIHSELFVQAGGQAGYVINKDYNGSNQYGFGHSQARRRRAPDAGALALTLPCPLRRRHARLGVQR